MILHNLILKLSTAIDTSQKYQKTKSFFRSLLNDVNYPYKRYFDAFMIFLIVISIAILVMNKSGKIPEWLVMFDLYFVTAIFALEYLLRLWIHNDVHTYIIERKEQGEDSHGYIDALKSKLRYMISLPALIDFVAIFPKFRIVRLLKLYHYMHGASSLFDALLKKRFEFIFLGYMLFAITFTLGSIFYLLEFGVNDKIGSYLDAIYWALVTISTVGYGDISPVTDIGKILSMFGIVFGIAMISFVTSVMVSAFSERFDELRNQDSINHVNHMRHVVVINGYGHLGATIAKKLTLHKVYEPVIIEHDEHKVTAALEDGYNVIRADGSSAKIIKELYRKNNIEAMLTLTSSDIDNIYFILNAKSIVENSVIYARMNQHSLHAQYEATKVNGTVEPYEVVDRQAFNYLVKHSKTGKSILFFGYTHKSAHLCKMLQDKKIKVAIYEINDDAIESARSDGLTDISKIEKYESNIVTSSDAIIVCAMRDESINVYRSITLRSNGFEGEIVALSDSKEDNRKLYLAGVSKIFDMYEESASLFVEMIEENEKEKV
ncbi:MAG: Potassium voltage-gated channel subfamily KQT; possible potassium channel, VIC family [uncultured Sulfurovum sp.]|uniref:Potassium voltage-gated channel subfamily KQT possible potassium channel, VIC family n=1 Tax=uncultured Sulfurovum sp. TaxID=269237 RepID=A0A6S6SDZ4_9BACT|nr:MAG: Potassium voltage-gated channel subfamily KQT; possible potassium channel, VIC family [uncultured Sulfurovum sp.]